MVDYRILGPLEVRAGGRVIEIGGPRLRALLVILLLRAEEPVPRAVLAHQLWGPRPPAGAQHTLEVYISRLRKILGPAAGEPVLITRPGAYCLRLGTGQLDARAFERLVGEARSALAGNAPAQAAAKLRAALSLWRGPALADLGNAPEPCLEAGRLEELRLSATEDRMAADLALGRHDDVIGEAQALVAMHPLRERLHGQLMVALYRSGRQADALAVYQAARRTLIEELGLDPGPALRELERAILQQDVRLGLPGVPMAAVPSSVATAVRRRPAGASRRTRLLAVTGALTVATGLLVAGSTHRPAGLDTRADSVGVIDTEYGQLRAVVTGIGRPNGVGYGAGAAWISDSDDDLLFRVDSTGHVTDRIPVGRGPAGVTVGAGEVWTANQLDGTVSEVNPAASKQVATIPIGTGPDAIAFGYGAVWVTSRTRNSLSRIDAATREASVFPLRSAPEDVSVGAGAVWVISEQAGELLRIDPADGRSSRPIAIGHSPRRLTTGAGSVWVTDADGTVSRFTPRTGKITAVRIGGEPAGVAYSGGAIWVADSLGGTVARIDPGTGRTQRIPVGNKPTELAAAGRDIWLTVLPSAWRPVTSLRHAGPRPGTAASSMPLAGVPHRPGLLIGEA